MLDIVAIRSTSETFNDCDYHLDYIIPQSSELYASSELVEFSLEEEEEVKFGNA